MPKISQLTSVSNVTSDDLFVVVNDPSGTPGTRKVTAQGLLNFVDSGLGVMSVAKGGTGATSLTGYIRGSGTSAFTASSTIPGSDISGNISGSASNVTGVVAVVNGGTGATTTAGARTNLEVPYTFGAGGTSIVAWQAGSNVASGDWSVVSGGLGNTASGFGSVVAGGGKLSLIVDLGGGSNSMPAGNLASGSGSFVGGGVKNTASGDRSVVVGGGASGSFFLVNPGNVASGNISFVGGGDANLAGGGEFGASFVGGGQNNSATSMQSTVCGGASNTASSYGSFVGGGWGNTASGGNTSVVGGGYYNTASGDYSVVSGGFANIAVGFGNAVSGGIGNTASDATSTVGGGQNNTSSGYRSTVGGGGGNAANGYGATIGGGNSNAVGGQYGTVGSGYKNTASGNYGTVGGGRLNTGGGFYSTVAGGASNTAIGTGGNVGGGKYNTAYGGGSVVSGGTTNTAQGSHSVVCGGGGLYAKIVEGFPSFEILSNKAVGERSFVGGGGGNTAVGTSSVVSGGKSNTASGNYATILGGQSNTATHSNVFLLGSNLVSGANDTTHVENLNVKNSVTLSSPLSVANGGTGVTNTTALASSLGLGTMATQNQNNVTITGGTISINGLFNAGLSLGTDSFSTAKLSARSPITSFKTVEDTPIFTVPSGYMFMVDTMEIVTTTISGAGVAPEVRFGISGSEEMFYVANRTTSNSFGGRHVIENPQNGVDAGSVVTFGITEASTATSHNGVAVVTGYLLKKT